MSLSCECPEWDGDPYSWCYFHPEDFEVMPGKRRSRCSSCGELIDIGAPCLIFQRMRSPRTDIEERIHGDEVWLASKYFCEKCGEIYLNLSAVGYCFGPTDNMTDAIKEYWELTGFTPKSPYSTTDLPAGKE